MSGADKSAAGELDRAIGAKLRAQRVERGVTQQELGDALGVSFQMIQKYERGVNRISVSMFMRAADALNVTPAELLPTHTGNERDTAARGHKR